MKYIFESKIFQLFIEVWAEVNPLELSRAIQVQWIIYLSMYGRFWLIQPLLLIWKRSMRKLVNSINKCLMPCAAKTSNSIPVAIRHLNFIYQEPQRFLNVRVIWITRARLHCIADLALCANGVTRGCERGLVIFLIKNKCWAVNQSFIHFCELGHSRGSFFLQFKTILKRTACREFHISLCRKDTFILYPSVAVFWLLFS